MAVSGEEVQNIAQALLGRNIAPGPLDEFSQYESGSDVYSAIYGSPEGINYRETGVAASLDNPGVLPTGVTASDVQQIYQDELGRGGADNFIQNWVNSGMSIDQIRQAISETPEGVNYASTGLAASLDNPGVLPTGEESPSVSASQVQAIYQDELGRAGADNFIQQWANSGMSLDEIRQAVDQSPEGVNYETTGLAASLDNPGVLPQAPPSTDYSPLVAQYYQELFNRDPQQAGLGHFTGRLQSGDLTEDGLRQAIIDGAQGSDRTFYEASQLGGPVYDSVQALYGRAPARGTYNPATGELEGGYARQRELIDSGELTVDQFRGNLVDAAYNRGPGGGQGVDYQNYLNRLGVNREGRPFLQDDGTYANVAYGSDLSDYNRTYGQQGQLPDFPYTGAGSGLFGKGGGRPGGNLPSGGQYGSPSYSGRMPGQYITGNQMYSGMPYGMTQPMDMMNFMQPMMQPTVYQPPQMSQQYMPNRGLMSGYSTGFGPYGGYQRPRFGGGKGGPRIMRPMGGKGGYGY